MNSLLALAALSAATLTSHPTQDPDTSPEERLRRLELQVEALTSQLAGAELGAAGAADGLGEGVFGLAPGASQPYGLDEGQVSVGGYGELLYAMPSGDLDTFDALRTVLYVGYKFSDRWLLNTEIEIEHGSTSSSSGSTSSGGSVSAEFAYLDYLYAEDHGARIGLLLSPMGLVNELHEPTTYLPARRSRTESNILPSTWREMGAGVQGETDTWAYRAYVLNGLNGSEFGASGLRGGRQKGNRAAADDLAVVGRLDYVGEPGWLLGGSLYAGDSGQGKAAGGEDLSTRLFELHAQVKLGAWTARALHAEGRVSGAGDFNQAVVAGGGSNPGLAEELRGSYLELGYDLFAARDTQQSLTPFVRYEDIDTQARVAAGTPAGGLDDQLLTFGLAWQPTPQVILKVDYEDWDGADDQWNVQVGYVF